MVHDNELCLREIKAAKNRVYQIPQDKPNKKAYRPKPEPVHQESMALMHELEDIKKQIIELKTRSKAIRKKLAGQKLIKGDYFNKPIMLYALKLEGGYWYVGMSRNPEKRFKRHGTRKGANWTKLHTPIEIHEIRDTKLTDDGEVALLENDMTLEYAMKYGSDLVRGGGYCQSKPRWPDVILQNENQGLYNKL